MILPRKVLRDGLILFGTLILFGLAALTTGRAAAQTPPGCTILDLTGLDGAVAAAGQREGTTYNVIQWMQCDTPPTDTCFDLDSWGVDISVEILPRYSLLDCDAGGSCDVYRLERADGDEICVLTTGGPLPACADGCAIASQRTSTRGLLIIFLAVALCLAFVVIIAAVVMMIIARRRKEPASAA